MLKKISLILLFLLITCDVCFSVNYSNFTLFRAIPVDEEQLKFLEQLSELYGVNYWRPPGSLDVPVEFSIGPEKVEEFRKDVDSRDIYATTINDDIQSLFDEQTITYYMRRKMETFNWQGFYLLDDIYNWLYDIQHLYRSHIDVFSIGKTALGRDILAAKVVLPGSRRRSKVIVEGGIHAREWISPAVVTYLINELVHAPDSRNTRWKTIALTYEWYIVPVLNPDGYDFTHTRDRLWRKNRRGVDINRNFDSAFGTVGISRTPSSETYCGEGPFSEQESQAMRHFVENNHENLEYYLAFHSYGQYMIIPYAHKKSHEENYEEVNRKCKAAAYSISRRFGTKYISGTAHETVGYMTSGVSGCWVKKTYKTPYVVIFELRDEGLYGFGLPPHLIMPTCLETMDGLQTLLAPSENNTKALQKIKGEAKRQAHDGEGKKVFDKATLMFNAIVFILLNN